MGNSLMSASEKYPLELFARCVDSSPRAFRSLSPETRIRRIAGLLLEGGSWSCRSDGAAWRIRRRTSRRRSRRSCAREGRQFDKEADRFLSLSVFHPGPVKHSLRLNYNASSLPGTFSRAIESKPTMGWRESCCVPYSRCLLETVLYWRLHFSPYPPFPEKPSPIIEDMETLCDSWTERACERFSLVES